MLKLVKYPDPRLLIPCKKEFMLDYDTLDSMFDLLHQSVGVGLSANQVGLNAHLFITVWGDIFVGLKILEMQGEIEIVEGCLSLPDKTTYTRKRAEKIVTNVGTFEDEKAIVIQHELDHLEGREPWNERSV